MLALVTLRARRALEMLEARSSPELLCTENVAEVLRADRGAGARPPPPPVARDDREPGEASSRCERAEMEPFILRVARAWHRPLGH